MDMYSGFPDVDFPLNLPRNGDFPQVCLIYLVYMLVYLSLHRPSELQQCEDVTLK